MTALADPRRSRPLFLELLAVELAPRQGRWAAVARIVTGCVITVIIAMVFQVPQPTYMAYIVFLLTKDEKNATVTSAVGALIACTLAILVVLGLELIDTSEPALRAPLMAMSTFLAMFTARTFALGPISFLAGFIVVLVQSLVDDIPKTEALTRATLWLWVVVFVPVAATVLVNLLFGQGAVAFMERTVRTILEQCETTVANGDFRKYLPEWRARLLPLLETAEHGSEGKIRPGRITGPVIRSLLDVLVILEALPDDLPDAVREDLASRLRACRRAIGSGAAPRSPEPPLPLPQFATSGAERYPAATAVRNRLTVLMDALVRPDSRPDDAEAPHSPRQIFIADAFSNPAHWQFALKTTMAVMISYAVYTLLDWPGTRTAIVTCFFVALGSLGETVHKFILRLSGAVIGGVISGLCIVFVLPHLTDIGQLSLLIAVVSAAAAWVATSSELLSYAGMQIAFAFFLGILQGYAPATDLTVLRDRIAGIVLGNIVITIVFSSLWPQSARSGVRAALAEALRAIADVIRRPRNAEAARLRTVRAMVRADHLRKLSLFELKMLPSRAPVTFGVPPMANVDRLAGAAFIVTADAFSTYAEARSAARLADWAESAAENLLQHRPIPAGPAPAASSTATTLDPGTRAAQHALEQLESEVQHVAPAAG